MSRETCERLWEVDAFREGRLGPKDAEAAERHAHACDVCAVARSRSEELDAWLANASAREPSALDLRRLRVRILRSVGVDPPIERSRVGARAAFASAIVLLVCIGTFFVHRYFAVKNPVVVIATTSPAVAPSSSAVQASPDFMATVQAADGARWTQTRNGPVEHVELEDGALSIGVRHRNDQERLIVDLPDGVLEDRGTTFDVEAHGGRTTHVTVIEGAVALRIRGAADVLLSAGSSWPPIPTTHPRSISTASPASANPQPEDDGSASYAAAVSLLRHRSYSSAAAAFHDYVQSHPHEPDAEDASYLEAVALAQSGDANGAIAAAERHLTSYPQSFHRKEASLLIARLSRDSGDCAKARKVLAPWLGSNPDPEAQSTLRSCAGP